jgi:NAD-dependent deacetylase
VHGSIERSDCLACGASVGLGETRVRLASDARGIPKCDCGSPLKPGVVLFGEFLPVDAMERAEQLCAGADVVLCVGSSLEVYPAAGLPLLTRDSGGLVAIVTQGPTPLDELASVRLDGDVVEELEALIAAL